MVTLRLQIRVGFAVGGGTTHSVAAQLQVLPTDMLGWEQARGWSVADGGTTHPVAVLHQQAEGLPIR